MPSTDRSHNSYLVPESASIYHFSDRSDIELFRPRAPLRHPHAEPLVYGIDAWHSPLYFFPRDCPRIVVWPTESTSPADIASFNLSSDWRMRAYLHRSDEAAWRAGLLWRYEFDRAQGFEDTGDIGVWISRADVVPRSMTCVLDLPLALQVARVQVKVVDSLIETAHDLFDFTSDRFKTSLHVSMIRTSSILDWPKPVAKPKLDYRLRKPTDNFLP